MSLHPEGHCGCGEQPEPAGMRAPHWGPTINPRQLQTGGGVGRISGLYLTPHAQLPFRFSWPYNAKPQNTGWGPVIPAHSFTLLRKTPMVLSRGGHVLYHLTLLPSLLSVQLNRLQVWTYLNQGQSVQKFGLQCTNGRDDSYQWILFILGNWGTESKCVEAGTGDKKNARVELELSFPEQKEEQVSQNFREENK